MIHLRTFTAAASIAAALSLAACGTTSSQVNSPANTTQSGYPATSSNSSARYGVVQSINVVRQESNSSIGAGTIVGAVVGGVLGNQVGKGDGNKAATVLGAAGGAYAGHQIEKGNRQPQADAVQLVVRLQDGNNITVIQGSAADIRVGDRVIVANGNARRY